jgi:hypothetical protein
VVRVGVVPCSNPSHRMALALTNRICKIPQIFGNWDTQTGSGPDIVLSPEV